MTSVPREERHELEGELLSFALPADWNVWEPPSGCLFLASAPGETEPFEPQVLVSKESVIDGTDASGYLAGNYPVLETTMARFLNRGAGELDADGLRVAWLEYSGTVQGLDVKAIDFYLVIRGTGFLLNCKAASDHFATWDEVFRRVGESLSVQRKGLDGRSWRDTGAE